MAEDRNVAWREELRQTIKNKERTEIPRIRMNELNAHYRATVSEEVNQGLSKEQAKESVRFSFGKNNTEEEIDAAAKATVEIVNRLR